MIKGIKVVSIWGEDIPEMIHFYKDILGLELLPHHHGGQPHFKVNETYLTIVKGRPQPAKDSVPSRFPLLAFRVGDLDEAVERLKVHGIEFPWGIEGQEDSRWVMFYDPAGNLMEFT